LQNNLSGESGDSEEAAFAELPAINDTITKQLRSLAVDEVVPACRAGEFDRFADSIEAYGQLAGSCFAAWQGGVFASPQLALLAQQLKAAGARGVGQSSWGPTLYAMAASRGAAQQVVARVAPHCGATFVLAHANRHGLRYEWLAGSD
jgi:predicted sugar kinase